MKSVAVSILAIGFLSLAACSKSSTVGVGGNPQLAPDLNQVTAANFVTMTTLSAQDYDLKSQAFQAPRECSRNKHFQDYNMQDRFSSMSHSEFYVGTQSNSIDYLVSDAVTSVKDNELTIESKYKNYVVSGVANALRSNKTVQTYKFDDGKIKANDTELQKTPEYEAYLAKWGGQSPIENCMLKSDTSNTVVASNAIYAAGTYALDDGQQVPAIMAKFQGPYLMKCLGQEEKPVFVTHVVVTTDKVKSSSGKDCVSKSAVLYSFSQVMSPDQSLTLSKNLKKIVSAPAR